MSIVHFAVPLMSTEHIDFTYKTPRFRFSANCAGSTTRINTNGLVQGEQTISRISGHGLGSSKDSYAFVNYNNLSIYYPIFSPANLFSSVSIYHSLSCPYVSLASLKWQVHLHSLQASSPWLGCIKVLSADGTVAMFTRNGKRLHVLSSTLSSFYFLLLLLLHAAVEPLL